ncbi:hypothetical protein C2E23DRAFT_882366 [Lenzites betulinus]|nr:hypothetical protein C2E23DRAFT_882366 [Lenzites betulinus]
MVQVARQDASRYGGTGSVDLKDISEADARKLMSEEHKDLGYRTPPGSLAAQAQAVIARREAHRAEERRLTLDKEQLSLAALNDAERIKQQRQASHPVNLDLNTVGEAEARKLMSEEHNSLGYHPPTGSRAAEPQCAAAKHPDQSADIGTSTLTKAARSDATRISSGNGGLQNIDIHNVGQAEARKLMSEELKLLGYRPPPGSLAATVQAAAAKNPDALAGIEPATLTHAALEDAKRIAAAQRGSTSPETSTAVHAEPVLHLNLNIITTTEARSLQSQEQKALGFQPPAGSAAAQAQNAVDQRADSPITKTLAASLQSQEPKAHRHLPESGTIASIAQGLADKNDQDGGEGTFGDSGL